VDLRTGAGGGERRARRGLGNGGRADEAEGGSRDLGEIRARAISGGGGLCGGGEKMKPASDLGLRKANCWAQKLSTRVGLERARRKMGLVHVRRQMVRCLY